MDDHYRPPGHPGRYVPMNARLFVLLSVVALTSLCRSAVGSDLELIQGRWQVERVVSNGVDEPNTAGKHYHLEGNAWLFEGRKRERMEHLIFLDPKSNPKRVFMVTVFSFDDGSKNVLTQMGIYSVAGDTLKLCIAPGNAKLPTKFESAQNSGHTLYIMNRDK
jgi:uncharacterized protein (TIGR03067 family)